MPTRNTTWGFEAMNDSSTATPLAALHSHWPEYLMEAAELGLFMLSACLVVALMESPGSFAHAAMPDPMLRRVLTGIAMGLTAVAIVYSPWGKQSGAHFNPAVTLTFWRLGKVADWDAGFYVAAQFLGAIAGTGLAAALLGDVIREPDVNYIVTLPGRQGVAIAFIAEVLISFGLMTVVLIVSNHSTLAPYTGWFCGVLVATYISLEAPLSGMSMNPARTFAPALLAHDWSALWIYFVAPPFGMLAAAELFVWRRAHTGCAKLHHHNVKRCIFCGIDSAKARA